MLSTNTSRGGHGDPMRDPDFTRHVGTMGDCRAIGELLRAVAIRRVLASARIVVY